MGLAHFSRDKITEFVDFLGVEVENNYFYGHRKGGFLEKVFWYISGSPVWSSISESDFIIVFGKDKLYIKKVYPFLNFGSYKKEENINSFSYEELDELYFEEKKEQVILIFSTRSMVKKFRIYTNKQHAYNLENYNACKKIYTVR